jgi:hypothetical protein
MDEREVPEPDALEQHQEVEREPPPPEPSHDWDAPEPDALEQAEEVPLDDDYDR